MSNYLNSFYTGLNDLNQINADDITTNILTVSDNINGITKTQLSYVDPTSSIQSQLNYLKTQYPAIHLSKQQAIHPPLNQDILLVLIPTKINFVDCFFSCLPLGLNFIL